MVKGTHRCGRIEHSVQFGQTVADQERVDQLCKHFEHIYAEIKAGDELQRLMNTISSGAIAPTSKSLIDVANCVLFR